MLDATYETFAKKRQTIRRKIQKLKTRSTLSNYREQWHPLEPEPRSRVVGAEDGSANHRKYRSLVFYAVNALALVCDDGIKEYKYSDVDLLYPYRDVENRLGIYRSILEVKASLQALDRAELFLIDGSIFSDLVTMRAPEGLSRKETQEVVELLPELETSDAAIASKKLAGKVRGGNRLEKLVFLEYLEYLSALQRLLEKGYGKLVGISKTSTRAELGEGIPDMAVFEEVTSEPGFSEPYSKLLNKSFPVYEDFFRSFVFTTCYARFEERRNVFMVEFPREIKKKKIRECLSAISATCVAGYPYPLRKAHREVVIGDRDMQRFALALGIAEKTGREVLA
jgi:NurA-like 5'-3' nuclease